MAKKIISITKDKIIGNLGLQIMPKNKIFGITINSIDFEYNADMTVVEKDIRVSNGKEILFEDGFNLEKRVKSLYLDPPDELNPTEDQMTNYDPPMVDFIKVLRNFTEAYLVDYDIYIPPYSYFSEEINDEVYGGYKYRFAFHMKYNSTDNIVNWTHYPILGFSVKDREVEEKELNDYFDLDELEGTDFLYYGDKICRIIGIKPSSIYSRDTLTITLLVTGKYNNYYYKYDHHTPPKIEKESNKLDVVTTLNLRIIGKGFEPTDKTILVGGLSPSNYLTISNPFINNFTTIKGVPSTIEIGNKLYSSYKRGREYGNFTTTYTSFRNTDFTEAVSGSNGELLMVGDTIEFSDFLPEKLYIITSVEFNASSGLVEVQFIKKIREDRVICGDIVCSDTLII